MRLAKSILCNESMPNDCLSVSPIQLFEKLTQMEHQELLGTSRSKTAKIPAKVAAAAATATAEAPADATTPAVPK